LTVRRVGENRLHLRDRQPEIGRDIGFVDWASQFLNDVGGGHTGLLQHGAATLHAGLASTKGQSVQST